MKRFAVGVAIVFVVGLGALFAWNKMQKTQLHGSAADNDSGDGTAQAASVADVLAYSLPAGWQQQTCPGDANGRVYVGPSDIQLDCQADPAAEISLLIDPRDTKDCQHLTAPDGVTQHICKSLQLDGHATVTAMTKYPQSTLYPKATTITDYFIDTGRGVVQVDYTYSAPATDTYRVQFEQLARSLRVK